MTEPDGTLVTRTISFPATWTVTFGPLSPGAKYQTPLALRIYKGKSQFACLVNVKSFIDLDNVVLGTADPIPVPRPPVRTPRFYTRDDENL